MGDSIQIDSSPMYDSIGFVCCSLFSMAPQEVTLMEWNKAYVQLIDISHSRILVIITGSLITTKSSHLWTIYLPRESYHDSGKIGFKVIGYGGLSMEVKSCGYRWVCKQDLQKFNLTMMNHEKSLALRSARFWQLKMTHNHNRSQNKNHSSHKSTSDNK